MKVDLETWKQFKANLKKDSATGCWNWQGLWTRGGYASFTVNNKSVRAHKWIFELINGPVPKGYDVHHVCGNRACVNPHHLRAISHRENMREAARRGVFDGELNGSSKMTDFDVIQARLLHGAGFTAGQLEAVFPTKKRNLHYILRGKTWKHLDEDLRKLPPERVKRIIADLYIFLRLYLKRRYLDEGNPIPKKYLESLALEEAFLAMWEDTRGLKDFVTHKVSVCRAK